MTAFNQEDLRAMVRDSGDYQNVRRFSNAFLNTILQRVFGGFWEAIADVHQGWWDTEGIITTVAAQGYLALPADCWRVQGIDRLEGSEYVPLAQIGISDRNRYGSGTGKPTAYRTSSRGVELYQTPDTVYTLRVSYTPKAPALADPTFSTLDLAGYAPVLPDVTTVLQMKTAGAIAGSVRLIPDASGASYWVELAGVWQYHFDFTTATTATFEQSIADDSTLPFEVATPSADTTGAWVDWNSFPVGAADFTVGADNTREWYNGWEQYMIEGAKLEIAKRERMPLKGHMDALGEAFMRITRGAGERRSAEPEYLKLREYDTLDIYEDGLL